MVQLDSQLPRRWRLRVKLSILVAGAFAALSWRRGTWRRLLVLWFRRPYVSRDPIYGESLGIVYSGQDATWEIFLDGLGIPADSPARSHVRQLFARPHIEATLVELFNKLTDGRPTATLQDISRLSNGISGHLHVLLKTKGRVPLVKAVSEDQQWLDENFEFRFPPESPLDSQTFIGFVKLIIVRRVCRTLIGALGVDTLRGGLQAPLSINISFDVGGDPFILQTVTPVSTANSVGERLGHIQDIDEDQSED